jgi:Ni/Fe-hydrogenase subunit HybB-like protein
MRHQISLFLSRWWFSALMLGVLLTIALISGPTQVVLSNYYYYVMLPLISR